VSYELSKKTHCSCVICGTICVCELRGSALATRDHLTTCRVRYGVGPDLSCQPVRRKLGSESVKTQFSKILFSNDFEFALAATHDVHAYEMHVNEVHAHNVHTSDVHAMRCTPMRHPPMKYTPMKCTSVRYTPMRCTPMTYKPMRCTLCEVHAHETLV
jgi:hypothetical protein